MVANVGVRALSRMDSSWWWFREMQVELAVVIAGNPEMMFGLAFTGWPPISSLSVIHIFTDISKIPIPTVY